MKKSLSITSLSATALLSLSLLTATESVEAAMYRPVSNPACPQLAQQLRAKINRLKQVAAQRRAEGNFYGERKLLATANVVAAHWGNLPCVGKRNCGA
ncbi:hypothetical protein [Thiolinea disciformis]|uniref:hypothetical protein n=1 Tax=Thiolinea disciformis TaxID=125614 RepID=UPI0003640C70|nr:hypothetical protein [Thiolinea disciformis]